MKVRNTSRDTVLGDAIREAGTLFSRMKGLLRTDGLPAGEGLWIHPCSGIHSFGMRYEFDVMFLDSGRKVVGLYRRFPKNRVSRLFLTAHGVLELPLGTIENTGTEVGDEISFES